FALGHSVCPGVPPEVPCMRRSLSARGQTARRYLTCAGAGGAVPVPAAHVATFALAFDQGAPAMSDRCIADALTHRHRRAGQRVGFFLSAGVQVSPIGALESAPWFVAERSRW